MYEVFSVRNETIEKNLAILGTQWANFSESPKLLWAKRRQMLGSGRPPIFMNSGGERVDESLCPD